MEKNIMITIAYNGAHFCGWQKQKESRGVQGEIEFAVKKAFKVKDIKIIGSGRTDLGVHAYGQVANFKVDTTIPMDKVPEVLNHHLPKEISVVMAKEMDPDFHSRYCAHRKTYRYQIYPSRIRNPFLKDFVYPVKYQLDFDKMKAQIKDFEGVHDFAAFKSVGSSVKTSVREIYNIDIFKEGDLIVIEVEGSGFLYNMVRIIAGTMVDIGRGRITEPIADIIASKNRKRAGHTAPPQGLFLKEVSY